MSSRLLIPSLLIASLALAPRLTSSSSAQITSQDRPEHPWLTSITSDPLNTITINLLGTVLAMALGSYTSTRRITWTDVSNALLGTICAAGIFFCCILSLGAPLDSLWGHSLILSIQISALAFFPFFYTFGIPRLDDKGISQRYRLTRLVCEWSPESPAERAILWPALGSIVGAWLGVIPLALDWDRPWQAYPLVPTAGAAVGYIVGLSL